MTSGPEHCSRPQGRAELFGSEAVHCSVNGATSQHSGAAVKLVLPLDGARLVADWGHSQSEHRVSRTFAQEMGVGFARYLQHLRVATALGKMSTGEGIAAAARDADFADQAHFGRTMRNTLGRSPGDVRRRDTIVQER